MFHYDPVNEQNVPDFNRIYNIHNLISNNDFFNNHQESVYDYNDKIVEQTTPFTNITNNATNTNEAIKRNNKQLLEHDHDYERHKKLKRGYCEDNDVLTTSNSGTKRPRCKSIVTNKEMNCFFELLTDNVIIKEFIERDQCCLISDKVSCNHNYSGLQLYFIFCLLVRFSNGFYLF
jgi:hypothetical protein